MNKIRHELAQIDREIGYITGVLAQTPDDSPDIARWLDHLALAHSMRFDLLEEPEDIQKVIEYSSILLTLIPDDHPNLHDLLSNFGLAYRKRFQRLDEMDDVHQSIEYTSLALAITPDGHPKMPYRYEQLALSYNLRFERLGERDDIEKAIEYDSQAVDLTPDGDPNLPERLGRLGVSYCSRFDGFGELNDIEKAIEYQSRGLALAPDRQPQQTIILANLGKSYSNRFQQLNELNDLEKAIECQSRAVVLTPDDNPQLISLLANLGMIHRLRFQRLGELTDLEKAIEYQTRTVDMTPEDHPLLRTMLANLGAYQKDRFERLGELDDFVKPIKHEVHALTLTPDDHPHLSIRLFNLGASHRCLFQKLGGLDDLEKAMEYNLRGLALTPDGHPDLSIRLSSVATSYSDRFKQRGELNDFEKAIEYGSRALSLTPDSHPELPSRLVDLASLYNDRFQLLGNLNDLEQAIEYESCALELTTDDHPHFCVTHYNLAMLHLYYYDHTNEHSHLKDSLSSFRMACASIAGAPREKFWFACRWATHASKYSALNNIEAYQATIDLLPQFIWLGATTSQRYDDLKLVQTLPVDAASAAIISSEYSLALEWLEHARCIVWNQSHILRSPLDQLQGSHPSLATQLQTVATRLHLASSNFKDSRTLSSSLMATEQVGKERRQLVKEYDELLSQARALPGFENFLQPMKVNQLVHAARTGPIVVLNCHEDCCDALLIIPGQGAIAHHPLPDFTVMKARIVRSKIETSLKRQGLRERGVRIRQEAEAKYEFESALVILWNDVVKPILDCLGYLATVPTEALPHVTWCPTGEASFLPLHAAGDYDQPNSRVFDYVISSYTPTLTALISSAPSHLCPDSQVLAIGQAATPGHKPLPGTKTELGNIKLHVESKVEYSQLTDTQATPSAVLDAMEQHDWVHLACHAHQNVYDPTKSGFFLHGGTLDLAAINQRAFKKKGLAFLSACQTATGDEKLPDEAVHLASCMLMAGYSSVIATMWSVVGDDAPLIADKVYSQLMKEGKLGNGEAGKALHHSVVGLRERVGEKEFGRWVPYIHIGS
ncbi:aromatic di-alanine and TPR containing protein [Rhizoctonia solani 123E]|uniref:Aromatic di-alanine and TPR containing protein n=1 Tax=Rhizoctonia solani 123E TaxID=1423351 RepID=A0A074RSC6_9AGAM|nr:aromatic di-alanine and TPR containing protein [Rhizoctonia solani 123E]